MGKTALVALLVCLLISNGASADEIDKAIWMGNAFDRVNKTNNPSHWYALDAIAREYSKDQTIKEDMDRRELNFWRWEAETAYRKYQPGTETTSDQFEFANHTYEALKNAKSPLHVIGTYLQYELKKTVETPYEELKRWQIYNRDYYDIYASNNFDRQWILSTLYDISIKNPTFGRLLDEVYGVPIFNAKIGQSASEILENNPEFATQEDIKKLVSTTGSLDAKATELRKTFEVKLAALQDRQQKNTSEILAGQQKQTELLESLVSQHRQQQKFDREKFELDGLRSSLFVLTFLIQDKRTARQVSAIGNAIVDFYSVTSRYNQLYSGNNGQGATTMGTAMLTMNYFAIFVGLVQVLSEQDRPPPEAILSRQIMALAKQIEEYQKENRQRFDRIDATLAQIFAEMVKQFGVVTVQLASVSDDLSNVRGGIAAALFRIDEVERKLSNYVEAILDDSFARAMRECINHKEATGAALTEEGYDKCAFSIVHFLDVAKKPAVSGQSIKGATSKDFGGILSPSDWSANINDFLSLATERASYRLSERRANPSRWAKAADAYTRLAMENFELFQKKPAAILNGIQAEGRMLTQTLSETFIKEPDRYISLIGSLLKEYEANAIKLADEATNVRNRVVNEAHASATWLEPKELAELSLKLRGELEKREILYAGNWPIIETDWPPEAQPWVKAYKDIARGRNFQFPKLPHREFAWSLLTNDPIVVAPELLGLGSLQLRYYVDVYKPRFINPMEYAGAIWGMPIVTIFAYSQKEGEVSPAKPFAFLPYQAAWETATFRLTCQGFSADACQNMKSLPGGRWQYDWPKLVDSQSTFSLHPVARHPDLVKEISARLDSLLVAQQQALAREIGRQESNFYRAAYQLNATTNAIRGLVALTLPGPSIYDDDLRAALYGRPTLSVCRHTASRVEERPKTIAFEPPNVFFSDTAKKLALFEGAKEEKKEIKPQGAEETNNPKDATEAKESFPVCSPGQSAPFDNLIDLNMLVEFLRRAANKERTIDPQLIDHTSLLLNVDNLANESSRAFMAVINRALTEAKEKGNGHAALLYQLGRIKALENLKEVSLSGN